MYFFESPNFTKRGVFIYYYYLCVSVERTESDRFAYRLRLFLYYDDVGRPYNLLYLTVTVSALLCVKYKCR